MAGIGSERGKGRLLRTAEVAAGAAILGVMAVGLAWELVWMRAAERKQLIGDLLHTFMGVDE